MNYTRFARRHYLQGSTPIEHLPNLSKHLGGGVEIFVKRDDLLPGAAGGNKTRKLEFLVADALEKGADTLITCGAIQSNHCRLTASWAAKEGLDCHLILEERVEGTYQEDAGGNNFLYELLGVKSKTVVPGGSDLAFEMEEKARALMDHGKHPYIIPGGGSNSIGALGYAVCAEETMAQLNQMMLDISHIILPSGSAGTHAGMVAGMAGIHADIPVSGINVAREKLAQEEMVHELALESAEKLGVLSGILRESVVCYDGYVGEGYAIPTEGMVEAVKLFARLESILLDPVYSGKTAAGMIDLINTRCFDKGSKILFLHTGGSPALGVYMDSFR
ncbi:MAG: D-cysteine desulfhydrase [Desulfobacteraceae bacterium]|nr:MAG: D-cysteine desulfhydrase [Desulfobacteraceae bacterium]